MKKSQSGFTLIELVVVIVLLGILGVTALGRFQDLSGDAETAAVAGIASEISASSALNYAEGVLDGSFTATLSVNPVCTTTLLAPLFGSLTFPSNATVTSGGDCAAAAAGDAVSCTIQVGGASGPTADAFVICTG